MGHLGVTGGRLGVGWGAVAVWVPGQEQSCAPRPCLGAGAQGEEIQASEQANSG